MGTTGRLSLLHSPEIVRRGDEADKLGHDRRLVDLPAVVGGKDVESELKFAKDEFTPEKGPRHDGPDHDEDEN